MRVAVVAAMILFVAGGLSCRYDETITGLRSYYVGKDCALHVEKGAVMDDGLKVDKTGRPEVVRAFRGERVLWCNRSDHMVTFIVSDAKVLGGRRSVRLAPGECVMLRVGTSRSDWKVRWVCWHVDANGDTVEDGDGTSPGKSEDTPPYTPPDPQP